MIDWLIDWYDDDDDDDVDVDVDDDDDDDDDYDDDDVHSWWIDDRWWLWYMVDDDHSW